MGNVLVGEGIVLECKHLEGNKREYLTLLRSALSNFLGADSTVELFQNPCSVVQLIIDSSKLRNCLAYYPEAIGVIELISRKLCYSLHVGRSNYLGNSNIKGTNPQEVKELKTTDDLGQTTSITCGCTVP